MLTHKPFRNSLSVFKHNSTPNHFDYSAVSSIMDYPYFVILASILFLDSLINAI